MSQIPQRIGFCLKCKLRRVKRNTLDPVFRLHCDKCYELKRRDKHKGWIAETKKEVFDQCTPCWEAFRLGVAVDMHNCTRSRHQLVCSIPQVESITWVHCDSVSEDGKESVDWLNGLVDMDATKVCETVLPEEKDSSKDTSNESKTYPCPQCWLRFSDKLYLEKHKRCHAVLKPYICLFCGRSFSEEARLKKHWRMHTNQQPLVCTFCERRYADTSSLNRHLRIHSNERPFACKLCDKAFVDSTRLKVHIRVHTKEKPYACMYCEKPFPTSTQMRSHSLTHKNKKPFCCSVCGKSFTGSNNLKSHLLIHYNERPFTCEICGKKFRRKSTLQTHARLHTNEKPFECKICDKKFADRSNLVSHLKRHGRTWIFCKVCKRAFRDPLRLAEHMKVHPTNEQLDILKSLPFENSLHFHKTLEEDPERLADYMKLHPNNEQSLIPFENSPRIQNTPPAETQKDYACLVCKKWFLNQFLLEIHMKTCRNAESLQEEDPARLADYMKLHPNNEQSLIPFENSPQIQNTPPAETQKDYACLVCKKWFLNQFLLEIHMKTCRNAETLQEEDPARLADYMKLHPNNEQSLIPFENSPQIQNTPPAETQKDYACLVCKKWFLNQYLLEIHMKTCRNAETLDIVYCTVCLKFFPNHDSFKAHQLNMECCRYLCTLCNLKFKDSLSLSHHNHDKHADNYEIFTRFRRTIPHTEEH